MSEKEEFDGMVECKRCRRMVKTYKGWHNTALYREGRTPAHECMKCGESSI